MSWIDFSRFWFVAFGALIAATWRLWLPPEWTQSGDFPSVPMVDWIIPLSPWIDRIILPAFLIGGAIGWTAPRAGWGTIALILSVAFLSDQHRLQPWAYQTWLYAMVLCGTKNGQNSLRPIRAIAISIYFYSAMGKLDSQFVHTVGQDFLATAVAWTGQDVTGWADGSKVAASLVFPIAELAIAISLAIPSTRRYAGMFAIAMHVTLIVMLSPLGMGHSPGVLVWNGVLAIQAYGLFVQTNRCTGEHASRWPIVLATVVCLLPSLERRGMWDHWTSWALYSPHSSRLIMEVHASAVEQMPAASQRFIDDDPDQDAWHLIDLSRFSLEVRGVPLVPQARVQLGLALRLTQRLPEDRAVRGVLQTSADRFSGQREQAVLFGRREMQRAAESFWLLASEEADASF